MHLRRHRHLVLIAAGLLAAAGTTALRALTPADLAARIERSESFLLVDVRPAVAYQESHIPGAINIPLALLPQKTLPARARVIVYGDGLGRIGDDEALAIARELRVASVDVLEGGYAAWQSLSAPTTAAAGAAREKLPGITYQQLVAAPKDGVILVDLRAPAAARARSATTAQVAAARAADPVDSFAQRLGVPVRRGAGASGARVMSASTTAEPADTAKVAAAIATEVAASEETSTGTPPLLVLVADSDAAANEAARQLRASGYHRFTILIGGTISIEHEGRQGSARGETEPEIVHGQN